MSDGFMLIGNGCNTMVYIEDRGKDTIGLKRIGEAFQEDVFMVTGKKPRLTSQKSELKGNVLIAGTIGQNTLLDEWIANGTLRVDDIKGKRECYIRTLLSKPMEGVEQALVVAGSDKLGAIYGIFSLSEMMGVSPWVYWGDVTPAKKAKITFVKEEVVHTSKEPSIKYRGFFMNDEWPSLGNWVMNTFGDFNERFYDKVFQLLLRLKGNFFWPAMWSASFCLDGEAYPLANADLAEEYGIVMGTSHHEPLMRASEEWDKVKSDSNDVGYGKDWNYYTNKRGLHSYWNDAVVRNKEYNSLITIGMRGERDSSMLGDFSSLKDNIDLLKEIILDQKEILRKNGLEEAPKVLALYKEIEDYYYGSVEVEGLDKWDELDDVTFLLSDDNFGNCRTLPKPENKDRKAGWGIYYHFDYHGAPISYEWVNSTPLAKVWDQMTMAYDYGIRDLWIVNVGDVRPQELPLNFFMDMAYDFETYGTGNKNKTNDYTLEWSKRQFGAWVSNETVEAAAQILRDYTRMNGNRRPEATYSDTFPPVNDKEWKGELEKARGVARKAKQIYEKDVPDEILAAYYGLVHYPAVASANVRMMNLYAGRSQLFGKRGSGMANHYEAMVKDCIRIDEELANDYNHQMANGKWEGMMSSAHIGFTQWNDENWKYPETVHVELLDEPRMIIDVEGEEEGFIEGEGRLPDFYNVNQEEYIVGISNGGKKPFSYTVTAKQDWITLSKAEGTIRDLRDEITVCVDWEKNPSSHGSITVKGNGQEVTIHIRTKQVDVSKLTPKTFVETHGYLSIEAEHFDGTVPAAGVQWEKIEDYGRTLSSMKMFPTTVDFGDERKSPYMEYKIYLQEDDEYELTAYFAPSNNLRKEWGLKYGISLDGEARDPKTPITVVNALPDKFAAGSYYDHDWCQNVLNNVLTSTTKHKLAKGEHILRFHGINAGLILQKLVLHRGKLQPSYYGPKESFYKKENL